MRRRVRRWAEAAAVLLAFPVAVALTVVAISSPAASGSSPPVASVGAAATVSLAGAEPVSTYALADRLTGAGFQVVSVDVDRDANSLSPATVVVYYERERQAVASALVDLLGAGTIRRDQVFEPGADLTIILGKDLQGT